MTKPTNMTRTETSAYNRMLKTYGSRLAADIIRLDRAHANYPLAKRKFDDAIDRDALKGADAYTRAKIIRSRRG